MTCKIFDKKEIDLICDIYKYRICLISFVFVVRLDGDFCYSVNFQNCVYVLNKLGFFREYTNFI